MITKNSRKSRKIDVEPSKSIVRKSNHFQFTERRIEQLPPSAFENGRRAYFYDDEVRGLCVAVAPTGRKNFVLYRFIAGRPERIQLGLCSDLTVVQARARARELNADIARGKNPGAERRSVRDEMTLQELFDTFLLLYAKPNKKTWSEDVRTFNRYLHGWKLRKISTITKLDVIRLHQHIGRTCGQYAANRAVELLSAMFNRGVSDWGWTGTNPAAGVKAFKERKRSRFLDANELPRFFQSLAEESNETIRDFLLVALLTGARRSNVQEMRWKEINWQRATWTIPAEQAKADEELNVVLTPIVMRILETRHASSKSEFAFPGKGKSHHLVEPKTAWKRILKRAGLSDLRLHDLRRTLGSWQAATGASLPIIGKSLGHSSIEATKVYARLNLDPVRESVERATQAMLTAGGPAGLLGEGAK
jgi:integrase